MELGGKCVFPTRVGMNRVTTGHNLPSRGIPHTRGDEPNAATRFEDTI